MFEILLFLLILFYVVPKLLKLWLQWYIRRNQRKAQQRMNDFFNGGGASADRQSRQSKKQRKKKKIDSNVGEYVSFEEITTDTSTTQTAGNDSATQPGKKPEPQVEDAEWEDIK